MRQTITDAFVSKSDTSSSIRIELMIVLTVELVLSLYLHARQYFHVSSFTEIPEVIVKYGNGIYTSVDLDFTKKLELDKVRFNAAKKVYSVLAWMIIIHFNLINYAWSISQHFSPFWPKFISPVIGRNVSFAIVCIAAYKLFRIPIQIYEIIKRTNNGLVPNMRDSFLVNYLKNSAVDLVCLGLWAGVVTWMMQLLDAQSFEMKILMIFSSIVSFVLTYPILEVYLLIQDMRSLTRNNERRSKTFRRFKRAVQNLCGLVEFPKNKLVLVESTKRGPFPLQTSFYFGFLFYRRIAIFFQSLSAPNIPQDYSTELDLSPKEIEAIVAHELGHWYYAHSDIAIILWHILHISTALLTLHLRSNQTILRGFGIQNITGVILPGVVIAYYLMLRTYYYILEIICNLHQHQCERVADSFAAILCYETYLCQSLIKISIQQQRFFSDDRIYSKLYHQHPSLLERLEMLDSIFRSEPVDPDPNRPEQQEPAQEEENME